MKFNDEIRCPECFDSNEDGLMLEATCETREGGSIGIDGFEDDGAGEEVTWEIYCSNCHKVLFTDQEEAERFLSGSIELRFLLLKSWALKRLYEERKASGKTFSEIVFKKLEKIMEQEQEEQKRNAKIRRAK